MSNDLYTSTYNPDVLSCIANLSNDEVFTPPEVANAMLDPAAAGTVPRSEHHISRPGLQIRRVSAGNCQAAAGGGWRTKSPIYSSGWTISSTSSFLALPSPN